MISSEIQSARFAKAGCKRTGRSVSCRLYLIQGLRGSISIGRGPSPLAGSSKSLSWRLVKRDARHQLDIIVSKTDTTTFPIWPPDLDRHPDSRSRSHGIHCKSEIFCLVAYKGMSGNVSPDPLLLPRGFRAFHPLSPCGCT